MLNSEMLIKKKERLKQLRDDLHSLEEQYYYAKEVNNNDIGMLFFKIKEKKEEIKIQEFEYKEMMKKF